MSEGKPIEVSFAPSIRIDGEIGRVVIKQDGQEIILTDEQARSLALAINTKFPPVGG